MFNPIRPLLIAFLLAHLPYWALPLLHFSSHGGGCRIPLQFVAKINLPREAWKLGFSFGLGLYCVGIYWIYIALHTFGEMPWWFAAFCTFCLCAFMALFLALVGYFLND
jgi:apolipoprotein N-acyltransferase